MRTKTIHLFFLLFLSLIIFSCGKKSAKENPQIPEVIVPEGVSRYGLESGILITKEITEDPEEGNEEVEEEIYFDKWGMREAKYTTTKREVMGGVSTKRVLTIMEGEWLTTVDLDSKFASRIKNPIYDDLNKDTSWTKLGENILRKMGAVKSGTETYNGKECDVWKMQLFGTKMLMYRGLTLFTDMNFLGMKSNMVTEKFEENVKVPEEKFLIPQNIRVVVDTSDAMTDVNNIFKGLKEFGTEDDKK